MSLISICASATSVPPRPLEELVHDADYVIIASITKVTMVDAHGKEIKDRKAMTGPSFENEIRFHLKVRSTLFTKKDVPPKVIIVRLWKEWHYELGELQNMMTGETSIFLLKGIQFDPVYEAGFQVRLEEREKIVQLLSLRH